MNRLFPLLILVTACGSDNEAPLGPTGPVEPVAGMALGGDRISAAGGSNESSPIADEAAGADAAGGDDSMAVVGGETTVTEIEEEPDEAGAAAPSTGGETEPDPEAIDQAGTPEDSSDSLGDADRQVTWPIRECWRTLTYWAEAGVETVSLAGEFTCNADNQCWGAGAWPMIKNPNAQKMGEQPCGAGGPCLFEVTLNPFEGFDAGELYAYKFIVRSNAIGEQWRLDPRATHHSYGGDCVNSALRMPACEASPAIEVTAMDAPAGENRVDLTFRVFRAADGALPQPPTVTLNGDAVDIDGPDDSGHYRLSQDDLPNGKHRIDIELSDAADRRAQPLRLPFWIEETEFTWRDGILYLLFIDRFANGDPSNDNPIDDPRVFPIANWHGGDLEGATAVLESGYFDALGVTTIWLSPVNEQVDAPMKARSSDHQIAPYHGYWPIRARNVDPRFGGNAALKKFVEKAHERGIRVLLDLINNQVHEAHEYVSDHPDWFRQDCVCGTPGCGWSEKPLSCLFASYLPDIDWTQPDARAQFIDDAVYWIEEFDVDGFRVDAVKHVETTAIYNLRSALSQRFEQGGHRIIMLGETAVSQADTYNQLCLTYRSGYDWINAYTGPTALDGQFDFPTHHRTTGILRGESLRTVDAAVNDMQAFYDRNHLHVQFLGSHDTARIASIAEGHPQVGCRFPDSCNGALPAAVTDQAVYERLKFAFGLLYTTPGIPLLYNGDEWAVPGGNDPDNRRGVPWADMLSVLRVSDDVPSAQQLDFLDYMQRAGQLRRDRIALRDGQRTVRYVDDNTLVYVRSTDTDAVLVALNQGAARTIRVDVGRWFTPDVNLEALLGQGQAITENNEIILTLDALSVTVLGKP